MHFSITFFKFEYCLTNFGKKSLKPIISSVTSIWPSQCIDAPIPIVGIETLFVIFFAKFSGTHSITIANAPELETAIASSKIFFFSTKFFPLVLKLIEVCGNNPTCP